MPPHHQAPVTQPGCNVLSLVFLPGFHDFWSVHDWFSSVRDHPPFVVVSANGGTCMRLDLLLGMGQGVAWRHLHQPGVAGRGSDSLSLSLSQGGEYPGHFHGHGHHRRAAHPGGSDLPAVHGRRQRDLRLHLDRGDHHHRRRPSVHAVFVRHLLRRAVRGAPTTAGKLPGFGGAPPTTAAWEPHPVVLLHRKHPPALAWMCLRAACGRSRPYAESAQHAWIARAIPDMFISMNCFVHSFISPKSTWIFPLVACQSSRLLATRFIQLFLPLASLANWWLGIQL